MNEDSTIRNFRIVQIVKEYTIKGFAIDNERLKNSESILTEKYFDELLGRLQEE